MITNCPSCNCPLHRSDWGSAQQEHDYWCYGCAKTYRKEEVE